MNRAQAQKFFDKHEIRYALSRRTDGSLGPASRARLPEIHE